MEDVIGGRSTDERFAEFLADWERIFERRVDETTDAFSTVAGVRGLILAGALSDPHGLAGALAAWFTAHRSDPDIVQLRLQQIVNCALTELP